MADGINVGDATLTFLADTQELDQAFARVQAGAQQTAAVSNTAMAEMSGASEATAQSIKQIGAAGSEAGDGVQEGMERATFSMGEARGEAALLGEALGIRLPRHVRSFVAELPGVGEALSAAFAATAVFFLIEALVQGTEKVVDFISEMYIFTESMKASDKQIADTNKTLEDQAKELEKLKKEFEMLGVEGIAKTKKELADFNKVLDAGHKSFDQMKADLDDLTKHQATFEANFRASQGFFSKWADGLRELVGAETKATGAYLEKLGEAQDQYITQAKKNEVTEQEIANKKKEQSLQQTKLDKEAGKLAEKVWFEMAKAREAAGKILDASAAESTKFLEFQLSSQLKAAEKESAEEIKAIKEKLIAYVEELTEEESALAASTARKAQELKRQFDTGELSGRKYLALVKQLYNEELQLETDLINKKEALLNKDDAKELAEFKKLEDQKAKLAEQAAGHIEQATTKSFKVSETALDSFTSAFANSVSALASGSATFSAVMEKMAESVLQSIAQMAGAQGAKELALGIADLAPDSPGFGHSGEHFAAAAEWFALDAALSAAGGAISGAASGGSGTSAPRGTQGVSTSSTSQSIGSGPVNQKNVQRFAAGGLISGPTMAMLGDSMERSAGQSEAAIPLDNPRAVSKIKDALGGGGGLTINIHSDGVISGDNLGKVIQKISQRVKKGQSVLHASNSFRVTKRSS